VHKKSIKFPVSQVSTVCTYHAPGSNITDQSTELFDGRVSEWR